MDTRKELTMDETLFIEEKTIEIIEDCLSNRKPYIYYYSEEPYISNYTGEVKYDRSGDVRQANKKDILKLVESLGQSEYSTMIYENDFDEFISSLKTGNWSPTYEPGCGKHWDDFKEEIEYSFNQWKNDIFDIYDSDTDDCNEELEEKIDDIFYETYYSCSVEEYLPLVLENLDEFLSRDNILRISRSLFAFKGNEDDAIVDDIIELSNSICNLKGNKILSVVDSNGAKVFELDEDGIKN